MCKDLGSILSNMRAHVCVCTHTHTHRFHRHGQVVFHSDRRQRSRVKVTLSYKVVENANTQSLDM